MKRLILSVILAAGLAAVALAGVQPIIDNESKPSGTSGPINTSASRTLNVMVVGTGFSGVVTIYQGPDEANVTDIKTLTLTAYTGKSEYYGLQPSTITRVDYTRSAGTLTVKLEYY